jgi:hypothetical protein
MTGPSEPEGQHQPFEPMPAAPSLNEQELGRTEVVGRPKSVDMAFILWLVTVVGLLLSLVIYLAVSAASLEETIRVGLERQNRTMSAEDIKDAAALYRTLAIVINLVFAVLVAAFAFAMRGGKNWARVTLIVLAGLNVVLGLFGFSGSILITLVELVLAGVAVVFMFRGEAKAYFGSGQLRR